MIMKKRSIRSDILLIFLLITKIVSIAIEVRATEMSDSFVSTHNNVAFTVSITSKGIKKTPHNLSYPVFKAFGLSKGNENFLYSPLSNGNPSGDLIIENTKNRNIRKISSHFVIEAKWSPKQQNIVCYTFSDGSSFGLAIINVETGQFSTIVKDHVFADCFMWDNLGQGVYYFQYSFQSAMAPESKSVSPIQHESYAVLTPKYLSIQTGLSKSLSNSDHPYGFPVLDKLLFTNQLSSGIVAKEDIGNNLNKFHIYSPTKSHEIVGMNILGSSPLYLRTLPNGSYEKILEGKLQQASNGGIVIREYSNEGSRLVFIGWDGQVSKIGKSQKLNFTLPLENSVVTQGGEDYPPPGDCSISSHTSASSMSFAYDFQKASLGAHIFSSADGTVVYTHSSVSCNSCDLDCPDYSPTCSGSTSNYGWGNAVIVQHPDASFTKYTHLQKDSIQVSNGATACPGLYIGRQGHTGCSCCSLFGCGDHLHFQRQSGSLLGSPSIETNFIDATNPLSCGSTYHSGSSERTSCDSTPCVDEIGDTSADAREITNNDTYLGEACEPGNIDYFWFNAIEGYHYSFWSVNRDASNYQCDMAIMDEGDVEITGHSDYDRDDHYSGDHGCRCDFTAEQTDIYYVKIYAQEAGKYEFHKPYTYQPNLTYYQPSGWGDVIVVSSEAETHYDSDVYVGETSYIDVAWINDGNGDAGYHTCRLYLDGTQIGWIQVSSLTAGYMNSSSDYQYTFTSSGWQTLEWVVDADEQVAEGDETDNIYSRQIYVNPGETDPTLCLSPTSFTFSATEGGSSPASKTLNIWNCGEGTLNWSVSESAPWLSLNPPSGSSTGETDNVTVSVNISGLSCGTHNTNITITALGATGSPKTVPVSLTITGQPTLVSSPSSFSFSATEGGSNPSSQILSIRNDGCGAMDWNVDGSAPWLSLNPPSGSSTGETDNVTVSVNISGLSCGTHNTNITITALGATGSPKTVPVSLTITGQPTLVSSPSSFSFSATEGGSNPSSQILSIRNDGCGAMDWNVDGSAPWLSLNPPSGSSTGETDNVTVSVNISGLSCGTHNTNITITALGATGSPKTVPVSLTITGQPTLVSSPSSFSFSATEGGSNPSSQILSIRNDGCGAMDWNVDGSAPWLSLNPPSGSSTGETDNVTVSVDISGLSGACEPYDTNITVSASGAIGSPKTVPVSLLVKSLLQFTDVPLDTGQTPIKAVHITELRGYIDCLRNLQGLGGYGWTDGTITSGVTAIKDEHIIDLRNALEGVYSSLGIPEPSWSGDASEGLVIRAEHIEEIRNAIVAVW